MAYTPSVQSVTRLATTSVVGANLGATMFIASGFFTKNRTTNFGSFTEIRNDASISVNGNIYRAGLTFFSQVGAASPFYIGRRTADDITFTPTTLSNNKEYAFDIEVYDTTTLVGIEYTVSITSDATATVDEIATSLYTEVNTTQAIPNLTAVDNTGSVTLTPDAGYSFVISGTTTNLTESYTTTETAATVFGAVLDEAEDDFYFVAAEDHSETFVLAMAAQVEATAAGDFPKQYHMSTSDANTLVALPDPAIDLLGKLKEGNYDRTAGTWSHQDDIFPELAPLAFMGALTPGQSTWKFLQLAGVEAARNLVTDKTLTTAKQGYIKDRNASWIGLERGVAFSHGGTFASGEWIDVVRSADWINDQIEVRLLNLFLNKGASGDKIAFIDSDKQLVLGTINGVLSEAVTRKILSGYVPANIKVAPSFADQATRTLDDIEWIGYLAGAVHFVLVDGTLTYADEALA
jgi:hypothetical protein